MRVPTGVPTDFTTRCPHTLALALGGPEAGGPRLARAGGLPTTCASGTWAGRRTKDGSMEDDRGTQRSHFASPAKASGEQSGRQEGAETREGADAQGEDCLAR